MGLQNKEITKKKKKDSTRSYHKKDTFFKQDTSFTKLKNVKKNAELITLY